MQANKDSPANNVHTIFIATGRDVKTIAAPRPPPNTFGERGKGGVFLPRISSPLRTDLYDSGLSSMSLQSEIQSLKLSSPLHDGTAVLGCTDSYGRAIITRLSFTPDDSHQDGEEPHTVSDTKNIPPHDGGSGDTSKSHLRAPCRVLDIHQLQPTTSLVEAGWTGIAIAADQPSQTVIARHFPKDITIFDGQLPVRTIHTMYRPYSLQLLPSTVISTSPLVVAAEGPMISVWDARVQGQGARVAKIPGNPFSGHIYCTAACQHDGVPLLAGGGADRSLAVWDPRKWTVLDRWSNCCKYEMTYLEFLDSNPGYCIVGGMDYEVVCGTWAGESKKGRLGGRHRTSKDGGDEERGDDSGVHDALSFRGDSKWMGLSRAAGSDVVAGFTGTKQLYIAEYS